MPSTHIAAVGIGNMGGSIVRALLEASFPVTIWNRTGSRRQVQDLVTAGATFEPWLHKAVACANVLILCVTDYAAIHSIMSSVPAETKLLTSKTVVNLTNGTPKQARDMAMFLKNKLGAETYFDGGIMVTPQLVGTEHSFLVMSGETEARYDNLVASLLKPLGAVQYVAEDVGAAALLDVAGLVSMYGMFHGAFMAMALLKRQQGSDAKVWPPVEKVVVPLLTALVPYVGLIAKSMDEETWEENFGNPMSMQLAAINNILQSCEEEGVNGDGMRHFAGLMKRVVEERGGDSGIAFLGNYLLKKV